MEPVGEGPKRKKARIAPPALPKDVLQNIFKFLFIANMRHGVAPSPANLLARIDRVVCVSNVCTTWADAAVDRDLWEEICFRNDRASIALFPDPVSLGRRWNALLDSIGTPVSFCIPRGTETLDFLNRCLASKRTRFNVDISDYDFSYFRELSPPDLLSAVLSQLRGSCTSLSISGKLSDNVTAVCMQQRDIAGPRVGLEDLVCNGFWPSLETVKLETLWERLSSRSEFADVLRTAKQRKHVYFPKLSTLALWSEPFDVNLGLLLTLAPNLDMVFMVSDNEFSPDERSPFLFKDDEFRLFIHPHFFIAEKLPGARSGSEFRNNVEWWVAVVHQYERSTRPLLTPSSLTSGNICVMSRNNGSVSSIVVDITTLLCTDNLDALLE